MTSSAERQYDSTAPRAKQGVAIAIAMLLFATLLWGFSFTWAKTAIAAVNEHAGVGPGGLAGPVLFTAFRFLLAGVIWFAFVPAARRGWSMATVGRSALLGLCLGTAMALQILGLDRTTEAVSAFLTSLTIIFVPILMTLVLRKPPSWRVWLAAIVATVGIYLLSTSPDPLPPNATSSPAAHVGQTSSITVEKNAGSATGASDVGNLGEAGLSAKGETNPPSAAPIASAVTSAAKPSSPQNTPIGIAFGLIGATLFACQIVVLNVVVPVETPWRITGGSFIAVGLIAGAIGLCLPGAAGVVQPAHLISSAADHAVWLNLAMLIVLPTLIAFGLMNHYQPRIDPTRAALIYLMEPVFAAAFAYVAVGRAMTPIGLFGAALILVANLVVELKPRGPKAEGTIPAIPEAAAALAPGQADVL